MIAVVQRVFEAKVVVDTETVGATGPGMLVLASVIHDDTESDCEWMAQKLATLRIFRSEDGLKHFERDVTQIAGGMLLVSNFTVAAQTRKGRRPSLDGAAEPGRAERLFNHFVEACRKTGVTVATGRFGANMQVHLVNDGPATFLVESDKKSPAVATAGLL